MIRRYIRLLGAALLVFGLASAKDKGFNPPPANAAKSYPAHEAHDDERVCVAIDPYDTPDKAAIFKVKYNVIDFLPVRLIITNDGDVPIMLKDLRVEYITGGRDKIDPATAEDIYRRIARPEKAEGKSPVPLPLPHKKPEAIKPEQREEVDDAQFVLFPVTPHSTSSGFLFFDTRDVRDPRAGAHIYFSGMKAGTKELFYFDIPLEKANSAPVN